MARIVLRGVVGSFGSCCSRLDHVPNRSSLTLPFDVTRAPLGRPLPAWALVRPGTTMRVGTTAANGLVAKKHVAVRRGAVALRRSDGLRDARRGSEQGNGSDQGGQNAFHGATPRGVGLRSRLIDG